MAARKSSKPFAETGLAGPYKQKVLRLYGPGIEAVDATVGCVLVPAAADRRRAKANDPEDCVIACTSRRTFSSELALIFESIAYLAIPDEQGKMEMKRFKLSRPSRALVREYDRTGKWPLGGSVVLEPPSPAETLEARREKEYRERQVKKRREAQAKRGPRPPVKPKRKMAKRTFRYGTGMRGSASIRV